MPPTLADEKLRDHNRFTGDGLPNAPVGAPLPVGDPASGTYNPNKADLRAVLNGVLEAAEDVAGAVADLSILAPYTTVAALRAAAVPVVTRVYRLLLNGAVYEYQWVPGSTVPEDLIGYTVINSTVASGRYIAVDGAADFAYVLFMGQSNTVGADPGTTGAVFAANSRVQVWRESTSTWVTPVVGTEPFNPSGSNCAALDFCNRIAEETGRQVRLILIADGSQNISNWVGTPANRAISVGNRPKWVELQTAMTAIGAVTLSAFGWIQGEANGADTAEFYAGEYSYLLSQMTSAGYLKADTPVIVSQIYQGSAFGKGNGASSNSVRSNASIYALLGLGDARLRVANSAGLAVGAAELTEGTQTAGVHFTDLALRELGRNRMYAAFRMAEEGFQHPSDFGADLSRIFDGSLGANDFSGGTVPSTALPTATVIPVDRLGTQIDVQNGANLMLPDFTHPTRYSSGIKNKIGWTVKFRLTQVGSCTVSIEGGGTGGLVRQGSIYGAGALESSITISAAGASTANIVHQARWTGARWDVTRLTV